MEEGIVISKIAHVAEKPRTSYVTVIGYLKENEKVDIEYRDGNFYKIKLKSYYPARYGYVHFKSILPLPKPGTICQVLVKFNHGRTNIYPIFSEWDGNYWKCYDPFKPCWNRENLEITYNCKVIKWERIELLKGGSKWKINM